MGGAASDTLHAGLGGIPRGDPVVGQDHGLVSHGWNGSLPNPGEPAAQFLTGPIRSRVQVRVIEAKVTGQLAVKNQDVCVVDRAEGKLRISWCADFSHRADPKWQIQLARDRIGHHHAAAWYAKDNGLRQSTISLQCGGEPLAGIEPIAKNHGTTIGRCRATSPTCRVLATRLPISASQGRPTVMRFPLPRSVATSMS